MSATLGVEWELVGAAIIEPNYSDLRLISADF